jgi:hypothetical protein
MSKSYQGWRMTDGEARVKVVTPGEMHPLSPRRDLFNHSLTGFEWGYAGSGPAQLALALLADALRWDASATALHQPFKFKVIARLPRDKPWQMTDDDVVIHAVAISELPLMRMSDGTIRRGCIDCVGYLRDKRMLVADEVLGVYDLAPGVTLEDTRNAVKGRHE